MAAQQKVTQKEASTSKRGRSKAATEEKSTVAVPRAKREITLTVDGTTGAAAPNRQARPKPGGKKAPKIASAEPTSKVRLALVPKDEPQAAPAPEPAKKANRRVTDFTLTGLIKLVKEVKGIVEALEAIWGVSRENREILRRMVTFVERHAKAAASKQKVNVELFRRTVLFADRAAQALSDEFYGSVRGWEARQAGSHALIRAADPEILVREEKYILDYQTRLRAVLADPSASYTQISDVYGPMLRHLGRMQDEAKIAAKNRELDSKREERAAEANLLLDELDELKALLD